MTKINNINESSEIQDTEDSKSRVRISKKAFDKCILAILDLLRRSGTSGASVDEIIGQLMKEVADELKDKNGDVHRDKKIDPDTVHRMISTLKKHGCKCKSYKTDEKYRLLDATWQLPVQVQLSYADIIALKLGWYVLLKTLAIDDGAKSSPLKELHEKTMKKLADSPYGPAEGWAFATTVNVDKTPLDEKVFCNLSFALNTGKPISLKFLQGTAESLPEIFYVRKLVLEPDGWYAHLTNDCTSEEPPKPYSIDRISGTQILF